jgi:hypothetical protein
MVLGIFFKNLSYQLGPAIWVQQQLEAGYESGYSRCQDPRPGWSDMSLGIGMTIYTRVVMVFSTKRLIPKLARGRGGEGFALNFLQILGN